MLLSQSCPSLRLLWFANSFNLALAAGVTLVLQRRGTDGSTGRELTKDPE